MIDPRFFYFYKTFYRIPFLVPYWGGEEFAAIKKMLLSPTRERGDSWRKELELALARKFDFSHVVLTSTGRFAIEVALRSINKPGGEVIIPTFGCLAVADAVVSAGYVPVFADINEDLTISAESVFANLTEKTVAVLVAHLSGKLANDLQTIVDLCHKRELILIDDAAQALGIMHKGQPLGSFGEFGILSFGLGKPTFSLGGGALVVRSKAVKSQCHAIVGSVGTQRRSRWREIMAATNFLLQYCYLSQTLPFFLTVRAINKLLHLRVGGAPRGWISELEAQLQVIQLTKLDEIVARFRDNGRRVVAALPRVALIFAPQASEDCGYTKLVVHAPAWSGDRLARHLLKRGIEIEWSYRPLDLCEDFSRFRRHDNLYAERVWRDLLAVPVHPSLDAAEVDYVASSVASFA